MRQEESEFRCLKTAIVPNTLQFRSQRTQTQLSKSQIILNFIGYCEDVSSHLNTIEGLIQRVGRDWR